MKEKIIATNRQAHRDYTIFETLECGIELKGPEVKSLREGKANLKDSFARIEAGEVFLYNMHISPYEQAGIFNVEPRRVRRLLLHKREINRLTGKLVQRGFTFIPLKIYFKAGIAKVEVALARGKRLYDKRRQIKKKELDLEIKRALRVKRRG
ncbi:MAG: SsrA-binding protein SmpB [Candidatus Omnitrophica bacterium]|nr:SsrA-binding protein SmpB [Candidatus Omnitrophota bacterium]